MSDQFTTYTSQSWTSRIRESIAGVLIGSVLVLAAFGVLFWNEGRTVRRAKTLEAGAASVITVGADKVDPANEGKLVHMNGEAVTDAVLKDRDFGIEAKAIKLKRTAKMYQWQETKHTDKKKKVGGGTTTTTTYTYSKTWSEHPISSTSFHNQTGHHNPGSMPYQSDEWSAGKVTVGAFTLSPGLVGEIDNWTDVTLDEDSVKKLPRSLRKNAKAYEGGYYLGENPDSPDIGDMTISFREVMPGPVSLVSRQVKSTFEPYAMDTGSIELLQVGTHTADAMFKTAMEQNIMLAWLIRLGGFVAMVIGMTMVFRPLVVVADVVPLVGSVIGAGAFVFALVMSFGMSLITISVAWVFYRPLVGIPMLVVALASIVGLFVLRRKKAPQKVF